jgi:hypothetical protein
MAGNSRIVYAAECDPCPDCGEPVCPVCQDHYADCPCPGPHSEDEDFADDPQNCVDTSRDSV